MLFFSSLADVPAAFGPSAVTVGKFDGLHVGHRRVIEQLEELAKERHLVSTLITFDRHPLALLKPERCPAPLTSNDQKRGLVESTGVDAMLMIPFTAEFARLEPSEFVTSVLVDALHAAVVLVGPDFTYGRGGAGDVHSLRADGLVRGFDVVTIEQVRSGDQRVSSTVIRGLLDAGDVRAAADLLGRLPRIDSVVVHGEQRGRELGYPTANLSPEIAGYIPADGVYAAYATVGTERFPAAVSIGNNPTFDGVPDRQVEAHLLDRSLDLYGRDISLEFVDYIRPMNKFPSVDALVRQMAADEAKIREILGVRPA